LYSGTAKKMASPIPVGVTKEQVRFICSSFIVNTS